ncbi:MAG: hypothetical protein ACE5R6_18700 [Candidatus Heimdallarchaeota archaeon]
MTKKCFYVIPTKITNSEEQVQRTYTTTIANLPPGELGNLCCR